MRDFTKVGSTTLAVISTALIPIAAHSKAARTYRIDIENELLARRLPSIADEEGGYACAFIGGVQ